MARPKSKGKELENKPQKQQNLHLQTTSFLKLENEQSHRITNFLGSFLVLRIYEETQMRYERVV